MNEQWIAERWMVEAKNGDGELVKGLPQFDDYGFATAVLEPQGEIIKIGPDGTRTHIPDFTYSWDTTVDPKTVRPLKMAPLQVGEHTICPNCREQVSADQKYCMECGMALEWGPPIFGGAV